jgi:hypothetical protein
MDVPDLVSEALDEESVLASVGIGGDDGVYVAPTRTLLYRGDGLLSDESVESYPHDFERLELSQGRRRSKFALTYVDGEDAFAVGSSYTQDVLRTVLAAHLRATGALNDDEQVRGVFRFNELTLVVGTAHLLKHVGGAVWSADYESFPYDGLTDLTFEEGNHALQIVVAVDGRPERIKVPNDRAAEIRRTVEQAVFAFHDVDSLRALRDAVAPEAEQDEADPDAGDEPGASDADPEREEFSEGGFQSLLDGDEEGGDTGSDDGTAGAEPTRATTDAELLDRLDELEATVERQNELLQAQQETLEQLVDELRRGR